MHINKKGVHLPGYQVHDWLAFLLIPLTASSQGLMGNRVHHDDRLQDLSGGDYNSTLTLTFTSIKGDVVPERVF